MPCLQRENEKSLIIIIINLFINPLKQIKMEKESRSADFKIATLTAKKTFSYLREALIDAMYEEGIMTSSDSKGYVDHHELLLKQTVDMLTNLNSADLKRRKDYK